MLVDDDSEGEIRLMAEDEYPRISDRFPPLKIRLKKQTLVPLS